MLKITLKFYHCKVSYFVISQSLTLSTLLLLRGDSTVGEKRRADSNSRAVKHIPQRGEECQHQSQDTGGHHWIQSPTREPPAGQEVEEYCGADLVFWTTQVFF